MKNLLLLLFLFLASVVVNGQDENTLPTAKGTKLLNVGAGTFGGSGTPNILPLYVGVDFFIINNLSLGFDLNWRYYTSSNEKDRHHLFSGEAVIDYHFNELMNLSSSWDFYAGFKLGPGYMYTKEEWEDYNDHYLSGIKFVFDANVGFRYYFNDKIGVNSEVGVMSVSETRTTGVTFTLGVTAKL